MHVLPHNLQGKLVQFWLLDANLGHVYTDVPNSQLKSMEKGLHHVYVQYAPSPQGPTNTLYQLYIHLYSNEAAEILNLSAEYYNFFYSTFLQKRGLMITFSSSKIYDN